ncbi:unnamed protein product, partial [Polarella glacialis]
MAEPLIGVGAMAVRILPGDLLETRQDALVYEPFLKDGTFNPFRPKAPEDLSETFKMARTCIRGSVAPIKIRRLLSVARGRELAETWQTEKKQSALLSSAQLAANLLATGHPSCHRKVLQDEFNATGTGGTNRLRPGEPKTDVDTEAEDSEDSDAETDIHGRPNFMETRREDQDGCSYCVVRSKGPLRSPDEPPDFLQLPEPIKQRTAGAARVAAAARAWAAASMSSPAQFQDANQVSLGMLHAQLLQVQQPLGNLQLAQELLPLTARGVGQGLSAAAIAAQLQRHRQGGAEVQLVPGSSNPAGAGGNGNMGGAIRFYQANEQPQPAANDRDRGSREVVAGPAVLALRRMRNSMNALAEGRLPFGLGRQSPRQPQQGPQAQPQQGQHGIVPQQPQQPQQVQQQRQQFQVVPQQPENPGQPQAPLQPQPPQQPSSGQPRRPGLVGRVLAPASGGANNEPLAPTPPSQPKPPGTSTRFWKRSWPRVLGWGGSSSSAAGAAPADGFGPGAAAAAASSGAASSQPGRGAGND